MGEESNPPFRFVICERELGHSFPGHYDRKSSCTSFALQAVEKRLKSDRYFMNFRKTFFQQNKIKRRSSKVSIARMFGSQRKTIPTRGRSKKRMFSLSSLVFAALAAVIVMYISVMVLFAKHANEISTNTTYQKNDIPKAPSIRRPPQASTEKPKSDSQKRILTAFLEPIDESQWKKKPLPVRTSKSEDLTEVPFSKVNSCSKLIEQWSADEYPDEDPFLPWIHDVFPTEDGKFIQVVAQNRRRCNTGASAENKEIHRKRGPQLSLFETVAVKRIDAPDSTSPRYRLASHEEADEDGMATRFICRFSNGDETLSEYNFNYEWASLRKRQQKMFHENESDNKQIHTSQLLFRCPVPERLVETVKTGSSVKDDWATLFMDLVPIRTPPRFGHPSKFLPPYYKDFRDKEPFDATTEWGDKHILPAIEDSGRWQNIPICKPSLMTYKSKNDAAAPPAPKDKVEIVTEKKHRLISCLWASAGYATRGERFHINDGQRRLLEWVTYNRQIGVEHFYVYDNSDAHNPDVNLRFIADMFPDHVTLINWPAKICNNHKNNEDNPGERSSQYAAEASCRLRFGPHTDWITQVRNSESFFSMVSIFAQHLNGSISVFFCSSLILTNTWFPWEN